MSKIHIFEKVQNFDLKFKFTLFNPSMAAAEILKFNSYSLLPLLLGMATGRVRIG
jgi:hypothetical protein